MTQFNICLASVSNNKQRRISNTLSDHQKYITYPLDTLLFSFLFTSIIIMITRITTRQTTTITTTTTVTAMTAVGASSSSSSSSSSCGMVLMVGASTTGRGKEEKHMQLNASVSGPDNKSSQNYPHNSVILSE